MRRSGEEIFAFSTGLALMSAEVVWNRTLLTVAGGSADSSMIVLSAVMAGLAAGGAVFGRAGDSSGNPRRALGLLALSCVPAFLMPALLAGAAAGAYPALAASGLPMPVVRALVAFALVIPPAFLGGGLIPLMARLSEGGRAVSGIAGLYALNTVGSATGGILTGFLLLEHLGATASLVSSSGLMLFSGLALAASAGPRMPLVARDTGGGGPRARHLALYAASGLLALSLEAVWSRQLTFILGNSTYAFSAMGASALLGMGAGSWIGWRLSGDANRLFGFAVALEGLLGALPLVAASLQQETSALLAGQPVLLHTVAACASMIPASICMGATFPLMVRAAARPGRLGMDVGFLSMANCLGAAAGPLFASLLLLEAAGPTLGTGILALMAAIIGASAMPRGRGRTAQALAASALVLPAAASALFLPPPGSRAPGEDLSLAFFDEDRAATVSVFSRSWDGYRSLRINGVEEVPIDQASLEAFLLLGNLPWGYDPEASDVLVIALGGGITSGSLLGHPVESLTCVEICPSVVEASPLFASENGSPELDPRFTLVGDDGRNYLAASRSLYDLVVCDATHPGSSDSWVLYTSEFYGSMLSHLAPGGVAAQWVPLHQLPVEDLRRILATWSAVFPYSAVHLAGGRHAILAGSAEPLELDIEAMFGDEGVASALTGAAFSPEEPEYLMSVASGPGILAAVEGAGINTDDHAPCQFIRRRAPADPQATIAPCVAFLLSIEGAADPVREAQMLYWSGRLPEAVEAFGNCPGAMGGRWLSLALTSAAEGFAARGDLPSALSMIDRAVAADPGWPRPRMLEAALGVDQAP